MENKNETSKPISPAPRKTPLSYNLPAADRDFLISYLDRSSLPHNDVRGILSRLVALKPNEIVK